MSIKERKLTCIVCPKGCDLRVEFNDAGEIKLVRKERKK